MIHLSKNKQQATAPENRPDLPTKTNNDCLFCLFVLFVCLFVWLVGWLFGWLVGCLVGWLVGWYL